MSLFDIVPERFHLASDDYEELEDPVDPVEASSRQMTAAEDERFHLAADDYPELWDSVMDHPSPERTLDGDPYVTYRARYRKHAAGPKLYPWPWPPRHMVGVQHSDNGRHSFAVCECGWVGKAREDGQHPDAYDDQEEHLSNNMHRGKPPHEAAFPGVGTGLSSPSTGDSGMRHTDLNAPPGPTPQVDFIPYDPGVRCSYCNIRPAQCTVNGAALCLEDAENRWGIPVEEAAKSAGMFDFLSSDQPPEGPETIPEEPGPDMSRNHTSMAQYQGTLDFEFHQATPRSMGGDPYHRLEVWDRDAPEEDPRGTDTTFPGQGRNVGSLRWHHRTGEIMGIDVRSDYRRQGVATELLRRARDIAANTRGVKPPRHSKERTDKGEAWARSLKERLPRRMEGAYEAAWRDVREKAKRLRAEKSVHLLEVPSETSPYVFAEVQGDTALHHCFVAVKGDEQGQWACSCQWGEFGPNGPLADERSATSPYKKTPCSHILATRWELQSRSMFGRNPYTGALREHIGALMYDPWDKPYSPHRTWDEKQYSSKGHYVTVHRLEDDRQGRPQYYVSNFMRGHHTPVGQELLHHVTQKADEDGAVLHTNTLKGQDEAHHHLRSFGFERHSPMDGRPGSPIGAGFRREPQEMVKEAGYTYAPGQPEEPCRLCGAEDHFPDWKGKGPNKEDEVPEELGKAPIPEGAVRLYHQTWERHAPSIREHGLLQSHAHGDSGQGFGNEASAGIWAATHNPLGDHDKHGPDTEGEGLTVEYWAHPHEISGRAESPWHEDPVKWSEEREHHVIMANDVKPRQIVGIHQPWHTAYHYIKDNAEEAKRGDFDWVKDDPSMKNYARGLSHFQKEGSVTDLLDTWFAGRFLHEAQPQEDRAGWIAPHRNPVNATYGRNPRATHFDDLDEPTQHSVRNAVHGALADAPTIPNHSVPGGTRNPMPAKEYSAPKDQQGIVDNIKNMFHSARDSDEHEGTSYLTNGANWYHEAHAQVKDWSQKYGIDHYHLNGATAGLSPSTDWDSNLTMAHYHARMLGTTNEDGTPNEQTFRIDKKHKSYAKDKATARKYGVNLDKLAGKKFSDMTDEEAYHAIKHQALRVDKVKRATGGHMVENPTWGPSWQSRVNGVRAIKMIRGEDPDQHLSGHKVRSFHNNLYHPGHTDDVTVDSHATSLAMGAKMGASSKTLKKILEFGNAKREKTQNSRGAYSYLADSYRKAHADLVRDGHMSADSTPADLQAVTWKRWRDLMPNRSAGKKGHESTPHTQKNAYPVLAALEPHHDDDEHFLDPFGGPDELDPDLHATEDDGWEDPEEPEGDWDELPQDDDYSDLQYERRKEGSMYDWSMALRQERRTALAAQAAELVAPLRPVELPVQYLGGVPHHLSSGFDEFGFEHEAIAKPSEEWEEDHSPGARNPASTAPKGFGDPLDKNWTPGKDIAGEPYPDERLLEPGPILTSPIRSPGFSSGYEVIMGSLLAQAQAGPSVYGQDQVPDVQDQTGGASYAPAPNSLVGPGGAATDIDSLVGPGVQTNAAYGGGGGGGYYVTAQGGQAQGGSTGVSYQTQAPMDTPEPGYEAAPINMQPPFPMTQAPGPLPQSGPIVSQEPAGPSQALGSLQDGLEWLRPPEGASAGQPGASAGMSKAASQDNLNLAAGAEAYLRTGQVPAPGFEVNMDTILSMPKGFMGHEARSRDFTPAEQDEMVREGEDKRASNLHMLRLEGSMYEELERQLSGDGQSQAAADAFWW